MAIDFYICTLKTSIIMLDNMYFKNVEIEFLYITLGAFIFIAVSLTYILCG